MNKALNEMMKYLRTIDELALLISEYSSLPHSSVLGHITALYQDISNECCKSLSVNRHKFSFESVATVESSAMQILYNDVRAIDTSRDCMPKMRVVRLLATLGTVEYSKNISKKWQALEKRFSFYSDAIFAVHIFTFPVSCALCIDNTCLATVVTLIATVCLFFLREVTRSLPCDRSESFKGRDRWLKFQLNSRGGAGTHKPSAGRHRPGPMPGCRHKPQRGRAPQPAARVRRRRPDPRRRARARHRPAAHTPTGRSPRNSGRRRLRVRGGGAGLPAQPGLGRPNLWLGRKPGAARRPPASSGASLGSPAGGGGGGDNHPRRGAPGAGRGLGDPA